MPHPYFSRGAIAVSMVPAVFGANAILRPDAALQSVQFPVPSDPEARRLARGLMRIYGIRNVAVSYLSILIWSTGDPKLLGMGLFTGLAMCITDGLVSKWLVGGGEWNHWSFAPVIGGLAAGLLGWFD
ncbi:Fc.00g086900.m01.CDS01 [Cosmosporella sp. VM-42]